jgi:hypothetical protein
MVVCAKQTDINNQDNHNMNTIIYIAAVATRSTKACSEYAHFEAWTVDGVNGNLHDTVAEDAQGAFPGNA